MDFPTAGRARFAAVTLFGAMLATAACGARADVPPADGSEAAQQCTTLASQLHAQSMKNNGMLPGETTGFVSHYNAGRETCYYIESQTANMNDPALRTILPRTVLRLWDATNNRLIGRFDIWGGVTPLACVVEGAPPCGSEAEWLQLTRTYMEGAARAN